MCTMLYYDNLLFILSIYGLSTMIYYSLQQLLLGEIPIKLCVEIRFQLIS